MISKKTKDRKITVRIDEGLYEDLMLIAQLEGGCRLSAIVRSLLEIGCSREIS